MTFNDILNEFKIEYNTLVQLLLKQHTAPELDTLLLQLIEESYEEIMFILSPQLDLNDPNLLKMIKRYIKLLVLSYIYYKVGKTDEADRLRQEVFERIYSIRKIAGSRKDILFKNLSFDI